MKIAIIGAGHVGSSIAFANPHSIFVVITNPVDVLTYLVTQLSGFSSSKIIGVGTLVDSARSEHCY